MRGSAESRRRLGGVEVTRVCLVGGGIERRGELGDGGGNGSRWRGNFRIHAEALLYSLSTGKRRGRGFRKKACQPAGALALTPRHASRWVPPPTCGVWRRHRGQSASISARSEGAVAQSAARQRVEEARH